MALTFFWSYNNNSTTLHGTNDYSAGDTTATLNSGATFDATTTLSGAYAGDYPTGNDWHEFASSSIWDNGASYAQSFAFSFYIDTWGAGAIPMVFWEAASTNNQVRVTYSGTSGSGNLSLRIRVAGVGITDLTMTGNNIALTTWYSCVVRIDRGNTKAIIELRNASTGALIDSAENLSITSSHFPSTIDAYRIGEAAIVSQDSHIDNVFVADAYGEALEDNLDIVTYGDYGAAGGSAPQTSTLLGVG